MAITIIKRTKYNQIWFDKAEMKTLLKAPYVVTVDFLSWVKKAANCSFF